MKIVIPGRSTSWNALYSLNSYWKRKMLADSAHEATHAALLGMGIFPNRDKNLFKTKVKIRYVAYFKNRGQDSTNICAKLYEDGLKGWVLIDDGPNYVSETTTVPIVDSNEKERLEITITNDD